MISYEMDVRMYWRGTLIFSILETTCVWNDGRHEMNNNNNNNNRLIKKHGLCSDSLWAGRCRDRIPVGARFSAPVQAGCEAHPASYAMGTGSFPGVKRPGPGVGHPPPPSAEVKERLELYLYSPMGLCGLF